MKTTRLFSKQVLTIMALLAMSTTIFAQTDVAKLQREANEGNARSMYQLALCYKDGESVEQDYTQAVRWFRQAAELGDSTAMSELGHCYEKGHGVEKNAATAFSWYLKSAENGCADGKFNTALCYEFGEGTTKDMSKAVVWYSSAALSGQVSAMNNLGQCYLLGKGVAKDEQIGVVWFKQAALNGSLLGMFNYAICARAGKGTAYDPEYLSYLERAANAGHLSAMFALAREYGKTGSTLHDEKKQLLWLTDAALTWNGDMAQGEAAAELLQLYASMTKNDDIKNSVLLDGKSSKDKLKMWAGIVEDLQTQSMAMKKTKSFAEKGDRDAMYILAQLFHTEELLDYKQVLTWCEKAAEKGLPQACLMMGNLYEFGEGVAKDAKKAAYWYEKGARELPALGVTRHVAGCMNNLARCYSEGRGVEKDEAKAFSLYTKAAENGYYLSMNNLGCCLVYGNGCTVDYEKAIYWFEQAVKNGYPQARESLVAVKYYLGKQQYERENFNNAFSNLKEAAESPINPIPQAMTLLAGCYEYGYGTQTDIPQAKRWREQAKRYNDEDARRALEIITQ